LKWKKGVAIPICLQQLSIENPLDIGFININEDELAITTVQAAEGNINYQQYNAASFSGKIERDWWLSSFSALNKNLHHRGISSPDRDNDREANLAVVNSAPSHLLRFNLAKGAHTGNLLHDILEHTDFCAPSWPQILAKPLSHYADLANTQQDDLIAWLNEILQTPLHRTSNVIADSEVKCEERNDGQTKGFDKGDQTEENSASLTLSSLQISQTLRETEFYFPMHKTLPVNLANILTAHRQAYHTLVNKNSKLSANIVAAVHLPPYQKLNGMMHGFIDLVFCHQDKYYLCDYKSSHLGNSFSDYQQTSLVENIEKNHYDLQYLIYSLALHRYLQQRLPNYNIEQHFGGVYYLYLRGMSKESQHTQSGVFYRKITSQELTALDQLFSANTVDKNIQDKVKQTAMNDLESSNDD
jgi:exodeoxyribonuclease V beta subunit